MQSTSSKFRILQLIAALGFIAAIGTALSACNTTEGFGQDVKNTGSAIKNTAQENK